MLENKIDGTDLIIRNARPSDAAKIIQLVKQVMNESPFFPKTPDEFNISVEQEESYINELALFLVAEIKGKIIGSATIDRSSLKKLNHSISLGITILKEYSGIGIGSLMMKRIIDWANLNKVEKLELEVFSDNLPAIALYKKFGFFEEGRKRKAIKIDGEHKDLILGRFSGE